MSKNMLAIEEIDNEIKRRDAAHGADLVNVLTEQAQKRLDKRIDAAGEMMDEKAEELIAFFASQLKALKADYDKQIEDLKARVKPSSIEWKMNDVVIGKVEGHAHVALNDIMIRVKAGMKNIMLIGAAGSGKTTLGYTLAQALTLPFGCLSLSGGTSEYKLIGRANPNLSDGTSRYEESEFVKIYRSGGVFVLDEYDAADSNMLVVINSALANGHMSIPDPLNPSVKRHKDCYIIAAGNTFGRGSDQLYVGRNPIDAASLDRFSASTIIVDYDMDLEEKLVPEDDIRLPLWSMREKTFTNKIRRIVGTRALLSVAALVRSGLPIKQAFEALVVGWTRDEVSKVFPAFVDSEVEKKRKAMEAMKRVNGMTETMPKKF